MLQIRQVCLAIALLCGTAFSATLQQMSLEELARQSTAIVHGRVGKASIVRDGSLIYTVYPIQILDQWKGPLTQTVEVSLPGGQVDGLRQSFGGVPKLEPGRELVLFLWTGPSGRTQITGLSQGMFEIAPGEDPVVVRRPASSDVVLSPDGQVVENTDLEMPLSELMARIRRVSEGGGRSAP